MDESYNERIDFVFQQAEKLRVPVERLADHFKRIASDGRKIVVKYDGDADGMSGALILYRMFKCLGRDAVFEIGASPVYLAEDAQKDLMRHPSAHFIFIDFANNNESEDGLAVLRGGALSISIIDHHLSERKPTDEIVVTPVWYGLDYNYTAGYLCYEVARRACNADYTNLWKVSLYCDKSSLPLEVDNDVPKLGLAFDYFASSMKRQKYSMRMIDEIARDSHMLYSIYLEAKEKVDNATGTACRVARVRRLENGITLVIVNTQKVVVPGEFPPMGKVVGMVHDHFSKGKDEMIVTVGYGSDSASLRATASAREKGFNANNIIQEIKREYGNIIISGGGHPGAAAIRFTKGLENVVVEAITKKIAQI